MGMQLRYVASAVVASAVMMFGGCAAAQSTTFPVWAGAPPGMQGQTQTERSMQVADPRFSPPNPDTLVWNVTRPTLTVYRPASGASNGAAVVVAPGGGFRVLSWANEGERVGEWLAAHGITAFVLKYRLHRMPDSEAAMNEAMGQMMARAAAAGRGGPPMPPIQIGEVEQGAINDGRHAVALVRSRAGEFGIDPNRIGIIGFSAGGLVSSGTAVQGEGAERPNFVGVIYSFYPDVIPSTAPPAFMAAAADDPLARSMPDLFTRWRAAGAEAELHIYARGQHGFGTTRQNLPVDGWLDSFNAWMGQQGFLTPAGP